MPRKAETTRLQALRGEDLRELLDKLQAAHKKLKPMVDTLELTPERTIEVDAKKSADTGIAAIGRFIGNCDKAMGL